MSLLMVVGLAESFRVDDARECLTEVNHRVFVQVWPPGVNEFVNERVEQLVARERLMDADDPLPVVAVAVAATQFGAADFPALFADVDRALPTPLPCHARYCAGGGTVLAGGGASLA